MSLHDAYARLTPFEIAFPDADRLEALAAAVHDEGARRAVDPTHLDGFLGLTAVGDFLAVVHGDGGQGQDVPRVALLGYGTLAYHAVHFVRSGRPLFFLTTPATRRLVGRAPAGTPTPPSPAGYLQLPQHLVWTGGEGATPESIDGAFWTVATGGRLHVLPVTGMRPDRPGFGTLAVPDAPLAHAGDWLNAAAGAEHGFRSDLPGAELDRLYAIRSAGEILQLMARFFALVSESPERAPVRAPDLAPAGGPRPSLLPYTRVGEGEPHGS